MARFTKKRTPFLSLLGILGFLFISLNPSFSQERPKWVAPAEADTLQNPFADAPKAWQEGQQIFNTLCFICHGSKGLGDGMGGVALNPRPANLISARVQSQSDGAIFWKITHGNPPMASYKEALTEKQRWQLVKLIRQLAENQRK